MHCTMVRPRHLFILLMPVQDATFLLGKGVEFYNPACRGGREEAKYVSSQRVLTSTLHDSSKPWLDRRAIGLLLCRAVVIQIICLQEGAHIYIEMIKNKNKPSSSFLSPPLSCRIPDLFQNAVEG